MKRNLLKALSMTKYERLLPRLFPGAIRLEVCDHQDQLVWRLGTDTADDDPVVAWSDFGNRIERRHLPDEQLQYRSALRSREFGRLGWLIAGYDTALSVPMATAPEPMRRAFADAIAFLQEDVEMQVECNQLAEELTETAAISSIDDALVFMGALNDMGCHFSLDDFGAGLSSFGYLKVLPVDYLKIDGSFIREVTTDKVSLSMVEAICQIGRTMGLATVAEFVGDKETVSILRGIGVDYVQGFYIGKPVPLQQITDRLQSEPAVASA